MPHYGFNFLWLFSKHEPDIQPQPPDERALDFMAAHGLDFVRIPTDYRFWTRDFRHREPDETVPAQIDLYLQIS
ncbi:MAG: hypothetical protein ABIF71_11525 [Planctomycetota bacterium]